MFLKSIIAFILFFAASTVHAQVQLAFFAGPQTTSARYLVNNISQPTQYKYGVMAGMAAKVEFENQFYFFPSIYYSLKGYKVTLNNSANPPTEFAKNNNTTIHTIEAAPIFQIDFNKKPSHLFVRFGPAVDFTFAGKEKFDTVSTTGLRATISRSMKFSFADYGRITAQAVIHFGYETGKGFMLFAFYEHGFGSMNNADAGPKIFHRIAGISFGWLFGKNSMLFDTKPIKK